MSGKLTHMRFFVLLPLLIVLGGCSKEPIEQIDKADQAASMESSIRSLEKSIVGKVFTLEREGQRGYMVFRTDGGFLWGQDRDLEDLGMAYQVKDNTVLVLVDGKEIDGAGRVLFSSSSPKAGDQLEWGPNEDDKRKFTIIKIEQTEQKDKADQQVSIKPPKGSLEESIVGKVITVALNERMQPQMMFNANGVMLFNGPDGNLEDRGLTYKIKGNEVLVFEDGERDGGILFSSSIPKVGDQVEMGPEDDKRNVTIIKIEAANEIINDPVRQKQQEVDSALSVEQAEALLARGLGQWEGSGVIKGADGEVWAEIPLVSTVRWLEEGDEGFRKNGKESGESKVQQMRVTEKLPQVDNVIVLTRWYDSRKGLFLLTRRLPGEEFPVDPGAEETYEADTETYLGIVRKGIPPGTSFTWTSQMTSEKWIYRGKFLENGKLGWTRVDTQKPVKAEPIDSLEASVAEISIWDAIHQGNIEAVKNNLARGFDIASKDAIYDGTPLHHAAYSGQNEVALFLINKGANVNAIGGPKGYPAMETPLDVAIRRAQNRTIDLLRKHGAKTVKELKAEAE